MRRTIAALAVGTLGGALLVPAAATGAPADPPAAAPSEVEKWAESAGLQDAPKAPAGARPAGVNPFLSLLPDPAEADYAGWRQWLESKARQRATQRTQMRTLAASPILVDEDEPDGFRGSNDTPATGQPVPGFGTGSAQNPRARILGTLSREQVTTVTIAPNTEDDGAIPLARDTGIRGTRRGISTTGQIGDGPHGRAGTGTGDYDFYELSANAGDTLTLDIDTPTGSLDPMVLLFDAEGDELAFNDDSDGFDSFVEYQVTETGTYFAMVTGYRSLPADPMDPASGNGAGSEGPYNFVIRLTQEDTDFYAVRLRRGDVLGASVTGSAARITVYDSVPREVQGSDQDPSFLYPPTAPLPGGGNAVLNHVAEAAGWHYIGVQNGNGFYDITAEVYRPGLEGRPPVQTLFLDFDGARMNMNIFDPSVGVRTVSPLGAFLARWGLVRVDEDALIDAIVAEVRENIRRDMIDSGLNGRFQVRILNSRDHADPFGQPNVSRVVVAGTIAEAGFSTIGIAQSIDPGNFNANESAIVLLDDLSAPAGPTYSLNTYLRPESDKIGFIGQAIGNVVAHEAGHFFGNYHTEPFNDQANLMDRGGNFPVLYGVGPDGIGGTADDPDVDFGEDAYSVAEGLAGVEDTLSRIAVVLTR